MNDVGGRRPGDWICRNCRYRNFANQKQCQQCKINRSDCVRGIPAAQSQRNAPKIQRSKTPPPPKRASTKVINQKNPRVRNSSVRGSQSYFDLLRGPQHNVGPDRSSQNSFDPQRVNNSHDFQRSSQNSSGQERRQRKDFDTKRRSRNKFGQQRTHNAGDLQSDNNVTHDTGAVAKKFSNKKKREHPIGYHVLKQLLDQSSEEIIMQLQAESSGFDVMLEKPEEIDFGKMCLVLQTLSRACETKYNKECLNILLTKVFQTSFIYVLMKYVMAIVDETQENHMVFEYYESLWFVLETVCHAMPSFAMKSVFPLIGSCIMGIKQKPSPQLEELLVKYESTKAYLENEKKKWMPVEELRPKPRRKWQDDLLPPDDFREIFIIPTVEELDDVDRPFLRSNIIDGKYDSVDHYLDVQFRLLREDFVRPLRLGIQEIKTKVKSQNRDIFIYNNVKILQTEVKYRNLMHIVQLSLPSKFKVENSKRLMYGNLVCFSCDDFQTILFGSICERKPEMLKDGLLGIKFDCKVGNFSNQTYTMVESRSYFVAYVHVLRALQNIDEDSFPMKEFIVDVDDDIPLPDYVTEPSAYDLQVIRFKSLMKDSETHNPLFRRKQGGELAPAPPQPILPLQNVRISMHLDLWPSCEDLRLDSSQRRALRRALTSKISIIQGPPGTGKTFLGLKITQVLLHNSEHWKNEHSSPILVVCFTNHALDQFLEGMMSYTQSIVRIGARSKNDAIAKFQINTLVQGLRSNRAMPSSIYQNKNTIMMSLARLERDFKNLRGSIQQLHKPTGIIKLEDLIALNVVPEHIFNQFSRRNLDLSQYLLDPHLMKSITNSAVNPTVKTANESMVEEIEVEHWFDAEDLYAEEEDARKLDDDDWYDETPTLFRASKSRVHLGYCTSLKSLSDELQSLEEQYKIGSVNDALVYERKLDEVQEKRRLLEYGLNVPYDKDRAKYLQKFDVTTFPFDDRWILYRHWTQKLANQLTEQLREVEKDYERNVGAFNEIRDQQYLHIMRNSSVVGMTTTGAAQYTNVLKALQPSIVIIEEAAEILEAHVVTALTSECQHLIMIGDHQQLQPSSTVYELATHYNLSTSLFERLIKNDVAYETLEYQHRMRPSISRLLVPSIYPTLKDHESVHEHPHIRGIQKDVFFINHNKHEDQGKDDNNSKSNTYEADFIMALCRHLVLQEYDPANITVLTPYSGQFFLLKKFQRRYPECQGVRISVVDNFQGEENDIILLSLVRSNKEGNVGFLRIENRVCVALSRARHGLYIIGNMNQLQKGCDLWKLIHKDLIADQGIGSSLVLKCENHPEITSSVSTGEAILLKSPEGGCRKPCRSPLECGHQCPKTCHVVDSEHLTIKCYEPCPLVLCVRNHPCPLKCWEKCEPCMIPVPKTFACTHTHKVSCSLYDQDHLCPTRVDKVLPICFHKVNMPCHRDPSRFPCPVPCDIRLPCGHQCTYRCHVKDDPEHSEYMCYEPCPRSPDGCSQKHKCKKLCFEDCGPCLEPAKKKAGCGHTVDVLCSTKVEDIVCDKKCKRILPCTHHCKRMCKEPCGGCIIKVKKLIPECQHEIMVECSKPALKANCNGKCKLRLPCGHQCQARCKDPCTTECKVPLPSEEKCPKGHVIKVPCHLLNKVKEEIKENEMAFKENQGILGAPYKEFSFKLVEALTGSLSWMYCSVPCDAVLDCEHKCKGTCGSCLNGRLHIACSERCERPLVCGHICKADCSSACPPCQAACPMKCYHSRCRLKCGDPCHPCQEKCAVKCFHQKCSNVCGEKCTQELCDKPCPKKLECGHPCVGYCGDPCPPLCRICNEEELTEILFGSEDEEDARFVLLEECGHVIEATGLKGWMEQDMHEIGMKSCPRCKKPIYNNRRFNEFILKCYRDVSDVKLQYFKKDPKKQAEDIINLFSEIKKLDGQEVEKIKSSLPRISTKTAAKKYHKISDNEMVLYTFQVQVLKAVHAQMADSGEFVEYLKPYWNFVKKRVMEQNLRIAPQMIEEITCELQRISILPLYWTLHRRLSLYKTPQLEKIANNIKILLDPTIKFDKEVEKKIKYQLKESEKYVGGLGITNKERLEILQAMDLTQGHWFKCPNGHIYCIGECGGAMEEAKCPDCGARIGGTNHRRMSDNALAPEMDGAAHEAYSEHFDIRNFVIND